MKRGFFSEFVDVFALLSLVFLVGFATGATVNWLMVGGLL